MNSLFTCPVCGQRLSQNGAVYRCAAGHFFDVAAAGYTYLLPSGGKHAKLPGDSKEMAAARSRFLSGDYYAPLAKRLAALCDRYAGARPCILDAGCGEGYYTARIFRALVSSGKTPRIAGIDISKSCLRWAAKREKAIEFAVASSYHMPIETGSMDLLVNCFSPLCLEEFTRVLKPDGIFIYVVPGAKHLWELKKVLYDTPYLNEEKSTEYSGFRYETLDSVEATLHLPSQAVISDLFQMTPYFWKTPKAGSERLKKLESLDLTASFHIHVFRKIG